MILKRMRIEDRNPLFSRSVFDTRELTMLCFVAMRSTKSRITERACSSHPQKKNMTSSTPHIR